MNLSEKYRQWVKETKQTNLTRNDVLFAEFLLRHEKEITTLGDRDRIFSSVRLWLMYGKDFKVNK